MAPLTFAVVLVEAKLALLNYWLYTRRLRRRRRRRHEQHEAATGKTEATDRKSLNEFIFS